MKRFNCDFASRFRILKGGKISLVVSALLGSAIIASAAPTGGVVTSGSATISQNANTTNINQSTQKASINWQNFNIASNETVNFNQPNANSITLNRVVGNEKSIINGALNANGQVWILNSNGILFNSTAKINTAGLIASTAQLSDKDFQDGNYNFKNATGNSVVNLGTIDVSNNGYVVLASNEVRNAGTIKAIKGKVYLSGNSEYTINLNGNSIVNLIVTKGVLDAMVENSGTIIANGGEIYLTTNAVNELLKGVVNNTGIIEANSFDDVTGKVEVFAHGGTANVSGTIEAKGGFVETSGKDLKVADGTVIKAKKWLIDPENVVIESTGGDVGTSSVSATAIETALGLADVEIQATNNITVNQAINIRTEDTDISESYAFSTGDLMLTAGNDININAVITIGPNATLSLNHGWNPTAQNIYGNGGKITFGMNAEKNDFTGKITFATHPIGLGSTTNGIWINDVEQTIIRDATQLQAMGEQANLSGNFVLANDINLNGVTWTPIGMRNSDNDYYGDDFKGSFNGLGHTISNLTLSSDFTQSDYDDSSAAGLFGNIAGGANISSVKLSNANITNSSNENSGDYWAAPVAALVAEARAEYDYDTSDFIAAPTIHNNIVTESIVQSTGKGGNVGAIVGRADGSTISGNAVTSTVISSANGYSVGGIVGSIYSRDEIQSTITDSYVSGSSIASAYGEVGGIAGYMEGVIVDNATVKESYIITTGTLQGSYGAGGIVGDAEAYDGDDYIYSEIKNSSVENSIIAAMQDVGGIVGYMDDTKITNSFYNLSNTKIGDKTGDSVGDNVSGIITFGGIDNSEYVTWLSGSKVALSATSLLGSAVDGYYLIDDNADFRKMLALAYDPTNKFKLTNHITLEAGLYLPVLRGELNGNQKNIQGLNVSQSYNSYLGLVGRLEGGTVKNLLLLSPTLNGYSYVGGIAGNATQNYEGTKSPSISNVVVNGFTYSYTKEFDVTSQHIDTGIYNIGAIAGNFENGILSNVHASSEFGVSSTITINLTANNEGYDRVYAEYIGGLLGSMYNSTLDTASSNVAISVVLESKVRTNQDAWNGNSVGAYTIGGLIGEGARNSLIKDVTANGAISVKTTREITVADDWEGDAWMGSIGGLFGYMGQSYIKNGTATNAIAIENNHEINSIGGIAGYSYSSFYDTATTSGGITLTLNNGATWLEDIGGAFGYTSASIIKDVDSTGNVTTIGTTVNGGDSIGGLVGQSEYTNIISSSYTGTIDANSLTGEISNIGGLVGKNYGYIENREYANFSKTIVASESIANKEAAKTAALAEYNLRADVIALKALGYTVFDDSDTSALEGTEFDIRFYIVTPDNTEWGVIKDSTASVNIKAQNAINVGGLVGYMDTEDGGQIISSSVTALNDTSKIEGYSNVGGLVGKNFSGNITDSHAAINVKANSTDTEQGSNVGGLVGYNEGGSSSEYLEPDNFNSTAYESYEAAQAAVDAVKEAFIAEQLAANPGYEVDYVDANAYTDNNGTPNSIQIRLDLVKHTPIGVIKNSYATGAVEGANNVGGLVGYASETNIDNSYATGVVSGASYVGGLVGQKEGASTTLELEKNVRTDYDIQAISFPLTDEGWAAADAKRAEIEAEYQEAMLTANPGYEVSDSNFGVENNNGSWAVYGYIMLQKQEPTVSITNSYATGTVIASGDYVGGLVGYTSETKILDSYSTGAVEGANNVGGLVGYTDTTTIDSSYSTGTVNGKDSVGGLVGYATGSEIIDSYHTTGKVTGANGTEGITGGLVGNLYDNNLISGSYATSEVVGESGVGGLIGSAYSSSVKNSYATGKVTATGLDNNGVMQAFAGGFAGGFAFGSISQSYATGDVVASGEGAGGLLGGNFENEIKESYATGKVTGTSKVGGLIGLDMRLDSGSTISDVYSSGEVVASGNDVGSLIGSANGTTLTNSYSSGKITLTGSDQLTVNGLIGNNADATVTNSFYDKIVNPEMSDETTHGKSTEELQTLATFTGIQSNPWDMSGENGGYATLNLSADRTNVWKMAKAGPTAAELAVIAALEAATNAKNNTLTATGNVSTSLTTANGAVTSANTANTAINTAISNVERLTTPSDIQGVITTISSNITTLTNAKTTAQTALQTAQTAKALAEQKAILAQTAYNTALSAGATIEQLSAVLALVNEANSAVTSATTALATTQTQVSTLDGLINVANTKLAVVNTINSSLEAATNAKVATLNATSNVTTAISTATSAITTATVASESINTTISNIEGTVNLALVQSAINTISNNITTLTNAKTTAQTALQTAQTAKALAEQKAILAKTAYDTALSEGATIEQLSAVLALVNEAKSAVTSSTAALAVVQVQYNTLDNMITIANLDKIEVEKYASDLAISNQNTEKAVTAAIKAPVIPVIQVIPTITAPKINVDVKPATQIKQDVALSLGISDIKNVSLVSQTTVGQSNQVISMSDLKPLSSTNTENTDVAEVRVPLSQNSIVDLVNGGVTLPTGVDQQFFVVATDNTTTNSSTTTTTNENNKNKKGKKAN